jgi:hypothetical protein
MRACSELRQGPEGLLIVRVGDAAEGVPEHRATYEMVSPASGCGFDSVNRMVVVPAGTGFFGVKLVPVLDDTVNPLSVELPGQPT